jgi:hypothetical protein
MKKPIHADRYPSDKSEMTNYIETYEEFFEPFVDDPVTLLELGVQRGGSLLMWRDYFRRGTIAGLDINPVDLNDRSGRIRVYQGRQEDVELLDRIAAEVAPDGFDIIIDDCAHIGDLSRTSFAHLFDRYLKPGGIYAIEDWGTGYWSSFIDGHAYRDAVHTRWHALRLVVVRVLEWLLHALGARSFAARVSRFRYYKVRLPGHDYGMVGMVKQLVDECGRADITKPQLGTGATRASLIKRMVVSSGHVLLIKAGGRTDRVTKRRRR